MIRLLPFIVIPVLIVAGLGYWRSISSQPNLATSEVSQPAGKSTPPVEVPKTLPNLNPTSLPLPSNLPSENTSALDSKIKVLESTVTELKARISALEQTSPVPVAAASKYPLYIPLGSSGGPWLYADWTSLNEYQVSINPDNYAGYSSMQLEVNFRIIGSPGKGYVRLYNLTDNSSVASEINTINSSFSILNSATFKLTGGQKLYTVQVKSTESKDLYIQSARIKVNF